MTQRNSGIKFKTLLVICLVLLGVSKSVAAHDEIDNRFVDTMVTEVSESSIAILAVTGVEHVIALDKNKTKVMIDGKEVGPGQIKEGDIVTIELDAKNPCKLARQIELNSTSGDQLAQVRRH